METLIGIAHHGVTAVMPQAVDVALLVLRLVVGVFFFLSGYHKLFNKERHQRLVRTLTNDRVPAVAFNQWWVPFWEFVGGAMLALGVLAPFAASALVIVCCVACLVEAPAKVESYKPLDAADRLDDYLYLPEVLYIAMLIPVILMGSGRFAIL